MTLSRATTERIFTILYLEIPKNIPTFAILIQKRL